MVLTSLDIVCWIEVLIIAPKNSKYIKAAKENNAEIFCIFRGEEIVWRKFSKSEFWSLKIQDI